MDHQKVIRNVPKSRNDSPSLDCHYSVIIDRVSLNENEIFVVLLANKKKVITIKENKSEMSP